MFISNTAKDREEMLKAIGVSSFDELVKNIPQALRNPKLGLPAALDEIELSAHIKELGSKNAKVVNFAGAGAYDRFAPSVVKALASRGEFVTAYTPYQAEASQGMLQAIYEYQSSMCALMDMEVSNASMYDAASALAEAVNAALRITGRKKVLLPRALHPHYAATVKTYFDAAGVSFVEIPCPQGVIDQKALDSMLDETVAAVVLPNPNFFGCIEDLDTISAKAKAKKAVLIAVVQDPVSLGLLRSPGSFGADIAVGEGQGLGLGLSFGGPYLGIFTCKKEHVRHMPGRICGITADADGKRAFVLTLQAREQHIRREKAASNICSNEALCGLYATMYLAALGPQGLKEVAELNLDRAHYAAEKIASVKGYSLKFKGPFFNEFVIECPRDARVVRDAALKSGMLAGVPLADFFPEMKNSLLVCATEMRTEAEIDALCGALGRI